MSEKFQIHRKIIERDKIHTPNTQIYFHPLSAIGTGTYGTNPPLSELILSCKCFPHVSKSSTLPYNQVNSVAVGRSNIEHYS